MSSKVACLEAAAPAIAICSSSTGIDGCCMSSSRRGGIRRQSIFRAMQTHGLIVADNGSDLYVSGTMDPRWNNDVLNPAFRSLSMSDFEVVRLGWR